MTEEVFFFMFKEHPTKDLVMIQVNNGAIQLNIEYQKRVFKLLKERLEKPKHVFLGVEK